MQFSLTDSKEDETEGIDEERERSERLKEIVGANDPKSAETLQHSYLLG